MLRLAGWVYGKIADLRNSMYDRGLIGSYSLGARTISIGNITTGGTGKTPLVAYVVELLAETGEKVCILTRGYGRENSHNRVLVSDGQGALADAREGGDEPVELARRLFGKAVVIADADRVSAAAWAMERFGITVFVLDDGFQHRRAKRDLDIVCIDATDPFGRGLGLPAGRLREPVANLARADAIVITRSDLAEDLAEVRSRIAQHANAFPLFLAESKIANADQVLTGKPALAFCGLGNPSSFFELLRRNDVRLEATRTFPDHHYYSQKEISEIEHAAREVGATTLLTTSKDMVKLEKLKLQMSCHAVEVRTEVTPEDEFRRLITSS